MSTLPELINKVRSDLSVGVATDESRLNDGYLIKIINEQRAVAIFEMVSRGKMEVNEAWMQTIDIRFTPAELDCDIVKFECPSVINLDTDRDGFIYVGHENGMKNFARLRNGHTSLAEHSIVAKIPKIKWAFTVGTQNKTYLEFHGNRKLERVKVLGIFNDPTSVPGYRIDTDRYPISDNIEAEICKRAIVEYLRALNVKPADYISDSSDKPTQ